VYSKYFQHRSEGLDHVNSALTVCSPQLLKGVTLVLQRLLKDKVFQVNENISFFMLYLFITKSHTIFYLIDKIITKLDLVP